jgi:hypothetical protein
MEKHIHLTPTFRRGTLIHMILENTGLNGLRATLAHLDDSGEKLGFVRWQWEYRRATYDLKLHDRASGDDYYLRISTRAVEGKLENPHTVLEIESVYIGRESPIPQPVLDAAKQRAKELKDLLS